MDAREAYGRVNDVLNETFFDGRHAGQPLYLVLDAGERARVASQLGVDVRHLESVIGKCVGAVLEKRGDPYSKANWEMRLWQQGGMETPPPCTAILFVLSHAAAIMEDDDFIGRNNYYTRLAQVTGFPRQPLMLRGISTASLWNGLNDWLLQNNYELGRPTARVMNAWKYVGFALSQAIVRAGDRDQFHDLFRRFGFSGNEPISLKEMGFYLSHWIGSRIPSPRLKKAWKDQELRERIIEAALAELAVWGSSTVSSPAYTGQEIKAARLSLLANIVDGLVDRKIELYLGRTGDGIQEGPFTLDVGSGNFHLANEEFGSFATLTPSPLGTDHLGLGQAFFFKAAGLSLEWQPRVLIPFALSSSGQWIEVARVAFGAPHLVLARDANNLPRKVEAFLDDAAIIQPTKETPSDMRGLPHGWVLYSGVQVRQPALLPSKDLECLVPLAGEGHLAITGGLQLLQGFYHSQVPLEARFVAPDGPTHIEVAIPDDELRPPLTAATSDTPECVVAVGPRQAGASPRIRFKAWHSDAEPDCIDLFLRDANTPTPLAKDGRGRLSFKSTISATNISTAENVAVEGFSTSSNVASIEDQNWESVGTLPIGETEERQEALLSQALTIHIGKQTCVQRGHHHWLCETLAPRKPPSTPLEQRCKDCGLSLVVVGRGKKEAAVLPSKLRKLQFLPPRERTAQPQRIDHDVLLDALSFLGSGNWGKLQSLIDQSTEESAMPRSVAQNLFLLGFIDLELRKGSNTIKSWCVPQPSLNFCASAEAFLSGFRSQGLVEEIEQAVMQAGGTFRHLPCEDRPAKITASGLDPMDLAKAVSGVRDPHGRAVKVNKEAAYGLLGACAVLAPLEEILAPVSIGRPDNLQWFNVQSARWETATIAKASGAYRWNEGLQYYAFRDGAGDFWSGPYQVVKLLAARDEGIHLHGYDVAMKSFLASLGSDVPGLLGRALVSCSGDLPALTQGIVSYTCVPLEIAHHVLDSLYRKQLPP